MIKKIMLAILIIFVGGVIIVQNDHRVHDAVHVRVKKIFQEVGNCSAEFTVGSVSFFAPSVTLENVYVTPKPGSQTNNSWDYRANELTLSCSWWSLLLYGIIDLRVDLDQVHARSAVKDGQIAILEEHIMPMVTAPAADVALYLKSINFGQSHIDLDIPSAPLIIKMDWSSESKKINDIFKTNVHLHDGSIDFDGRIILAKIAGSTSFDLRATAQLVNFELQTDCAAELEQLPEGKKDCFINGSWHNDTGTFVLKSADQKMLFPTITLQHDDRGVHFQAQGSLPIQYILGHIDPALKDFELGGFSDLKVTGLISQSDLELQGTCAAKNVVYNNITLGDSADITFAKKDYIMQGSVAVNHSVLGAIGGSWRYDLESKKGNCRITNYGSITVPGIPLWAVAEHGATIDITLDESHLVKGVYKAAAGSSILGGSITGQGEFSFDGSQFWSAGMMNDSTYRVAFDVKPQLRLQTLVYQDSQSKKLIDIHADSPNSVNFQGPIEFDLLRLIIKELLGYTMQGEGSFFFQGTLADTLLQTKLALLDGGVIRLPQTYNVMNQFNANVVVDVAKKKVDIKEVSCHLHRGKLAIHDGTLLFDDSYAIAQASIPVTFDKCLLNHKKELFAMFSGSLNFTKEHEMLPKLTGHVSIDQSQLKENLFSDKFQKELFAFTGNMFQTKSEYDMACDVAISTKESIGINTAFFHGQAHALMHIGGTVGDPKLSGSIDVLSGSLEFPYKPLTISKGHIYFLPDQMYDPSIELIAINKIKKYDVMLHVTGSLLHHDIALESNPPLTDEQVIALLLVGSQEQSLNAVMPALVMQNLKTVLFDSEQSPLRLSSIFNSWLDPLRRINLVPRFSDQSGRGGLRGALEIEVNDRWRVVAEQNFSLSEDTSFEVDYAVSDDVTLRGIRNERCDVGGEVEMRWKFGS